MSELSAQGRAAVLASVGGMGFSAMVTQLSLLRELLGAFSGNELVLGICLGNWFVATAAGAWVGRSAARLERPERALVAAMAALAVIPLAQVAALRGMRDLVFLRGEAIGLGGAWIGSLALLAPYCLAAGSTLTLGCRLAGGGGSLRRVYLADAVGSVIGGAAFVFILVPRFDHVAVLTVPAFLNLLLAGYLAAITRLPALGAVAVACAAGLAALLARTDPDAVTTAWQHRGERVVLRANSPYGRLVVCETAGMVTFYENGMPVAATQNTDQVEEAVHYALAQRPLARRVLLIGGGVAGDAREILLYPDIQQVAYAELDPSILEAGKRLVPRNLADPRIRALAADGRQLVREGAGPFDVIVLDLPDPSTSQINRYYTAEFFAAAHRALAPDGVLAFGLGHYENFVGPELARLLASAARTAATSFRSVIMIPGGRVFFLLSDGPLTTHIAARLEAQGIHPRLVNRHYLAAVLAPDRLADVQRAAALPADINRDLNPVLYHYELRRWMSQFGPAGGLLSGALSILLAACVVWFKPVQRVLFASGFAASGMEVVLLLGFQMLYGSVYRQMGLVFAFFMAGLVAGAWAARLPPLRSSPGAWLAVLGFGIAAGSAAVPWLLRGAGLLDGPAGQALLFGGAFALAGLVGAQFPLAEVGPARVGRPGPAGIFGADLAGAALGALVVSSVLVPVLGVDAVCLLTAVLNCGAAGIAWAKRPCTLSTSSA